MIDIDKLLRRVETVACQESEDVDSYDGKSHFISANTADMLPAVITEVLTAVAGAYFQQDDPALRSQGGIWAEVAALVAERTEIPQEAEVSE